MDAESNTLEAAGSHQARLLALFAEMGLPVTTAANDDDYCPAAETEVEVTGGLDDMGCGVIFYFDATGKLVGHRIRE